MWDDVCPFHMSTLRQAYLVSGPLCNPRVGSVRCFAALIDEACMNVCCTTLFLNELVSSVVGRPDVTAEAGRLGLMGREPRRREY